MRSQVQPRVSNNRGKGLGTGFKSNSIAVPNFLIHSSRLIGFVCVGMFEFELQVSKMLVFQISRNKGLINTHMIFNGDDSRIFFFA